MRQETKDMRQETRDKRQKTRDKIQKARNSEISQLNNFQIKRPPVAKQGVLIIVTLRTEFKCCNPYKSYFHHQ